MKKTLSVLAILGIAGIIGTQPTNAFDWSNLNPAYWGHCSRCEKKKPECGCKKVKKCNPCRNYTTPCDKPTGAAAPCDPCQKPIQKNCEPCDRLQEMAK